VRKKRDESEMEVLKKERDGRIREFVAITLPAMVGES